MDALDQLETIAQCVARKVSPTLEQQAKEKRLAQNLIRLLSKALPLAKLHLVGSTARDTGLQGDNDIDVFAAFDRELSEEFIVKKTVDACKKTFPKAGWQMHYAEHPYLQGQIQGYRVEVIPCYKTKPGQKIQSAVDRTPLHMDFLQKQLTASQSQDVRALKRLLKTHGIYGAELRVRGFSGLLCEYLVLNYRSFAGLMDAVRQWMPPVRIDMTSGPNQSSPAKFDAPLVLIDAVDENRNVAAVVSSTQVHRFISLCQVLWKNPSEKLFFQQKTKPTSAAQLQKTFKNRGTDWLLLQMKKPGVVEDILWPQLERTAHNIEKQLRLRDFLVLNTHVFEDEKNTYIFAELQNAQLPSIRKTQGPSIIHEAQVRQFISGKKPLRGPWIENDRVWVEEKRTVTNARIFIEQMQKQPERYGVGSCLIQPFKRAKTLTKAAALTSDARQQLVTFLTGREAWL